MRTWDPPFPLDLRRIRPADEAYWDRYRATPKAFVTLAGGQALWQSRFGRLTSVRVAHPRALARGRAAEAASTPKEAGFTVSAVQARRARDRREARWTWAPTSSTSASF